MTSYIGVDESYWLRRSDMMYYKYIDTLVKAFAYNAKSIIDIGSANTKYIEEFYWIPQKYTLDVKKPYSSSVVKAIEADFLTYSPDQKFDFVTCLQVLEHIPEVDKFAKKLFEISDRVLISVPYLWPEGSEFDHVNDPVDKGKLKKWTGREPSYSIIVSEPLRNQSKGKSQRLICYYGPEEKIDYDQAMKNVKKLNKEENNMYKKLEEKLSQISESQNKYYELLKLDLEINALETDLKNKRLINKEYETKVNELRKEINRYNSRLHEFSIDKNYYIKEYNKKLKSTSWRSMAPVRKIGSLAKKLKKSN